jgi:hypothetical protein
VDLKLISGCPFPHYRQRLFVASPMYTFLGSSR